jgi:hypothetical protein
VLPRATFLAVALTLLLAAGWRGDAAAAVHPCDRLGDTVVKNRYVRVFHDEDLFACSYESRRTMDVGYVYSSSAGFFDSYGFMLAGRFVAYHRIECTGGPPCETDELRIVDMRRFKQIMRHPFDEDEGSRGVVLKPNGSAAWLVAKVDSFGNSTGPVTLHRRDRRGRAVLASGTGDAAPRDLRLAGSTIRWFEGERERSKSLR